MRSVSRRTFLGTASLSVMAVHSGCGGGEYPDPAQPMARNHPLEGIARQNIRITGIRVTPLSYVPPDGRVLWMYNNDDTWKTDGALTEVFTDQGITGIGEGTPYEYPDKIKQYTEDYIQPLLVGKNPFDVEHLTCNGLNRRDRAPWAGVENALWDIIGKAAGLPVYKLLNLDGAPDPHVHIYASGGNYHDWMNNGDDTLIEEALGYQAQGFDAFKFRTGTNWDEAGMNLAKFIPILERLRAAVGPDFRLIHETMGTSNLTLDEVVEGFCPVLEDLGFYWFEDPYPPLENYGRINMALDTVMVSGHFGMTTRFDAKEWIDRDLVDITQVDANIAGLTEAFAIAHAGALQGKFHCPHNWHGGLTTMANTHLTAAIPNRHYCELNMTFNPLKEDVFKKPLTVKNGYIDLPDKPGFGVEVVEDVGLMFPYVPGSYHRPRS